MTAELSAHFFLTRPPYKMASPGKLMSPTSVPAVNCQAVSPEFTYGGAEINGLASAKYNQNSLFMISAWHDTSGDVPMLQGIPAAGKAH